MAGLTGRWRPAHICAMPVRVLLIAGILAGFACGPSGEEPRAGWKTYETEGGEYRIRYLSPPWRIESPTAGTTLTLKVRSNAEHFVPDAALIIPPKYLLTVDTAAGSAQDRIEALDGTPDDGMTADGEPIVAGPRRVTTEAGDEGWELLTTFMVDDALTRRRRVVFLDRPEGGVVSLEFEANPDLDEPQVDAMVTGVEVDPET